MSYNNFEEYFSSKLKIKDDNDFQEKLDSLLNNKNKNKIDIAKKEKEEQEKLLKQRLKDESNEKKIDFILSDEISFEQFNIKNEIKTMREEKQNKGNDLDDIFLSVINNNNNYNFIDNYKNEISSGVTNTENLINIENDKKDMDLINLGEDIKNNNPLLYNWQKIKKFK